MLSSLLNETISLFLPAINRNHCQFNYKLCEEKKEDYGNDGEKKGDCYFHYAISILVCSNSIAWNLRRLYRNVCSHSFDEDVK